MAKQLLYNSVADRLDSNFCESFEYNRKYLEKGTLLNLIETDNPQVASILKSNSSNFLMPRTTFKIPKTTYLFALIFLLSPFINNKVLATSLIELVKFQKNRSWSNWRKDVKNFGLENGGYYLYDLVTDREFLESIGASALVIGLTMVGTILFENTKKATIPPYVSMLPELIAKYGLPEIVYPPFPVLPVLNETVTVCKLFSASKFIPNLPTLHEKLGEKLFPLFVAYTCQIGNCDTPEGMPPCLFSLDVPGDVEYMRAILEEGKSLFAFFANHTIEREDFSAMEVVMKLANLVEGNIPPLIRYCIEYGGSRSDEFYPLPPHA